MCGKSLVFRFLTISYYILARINLFNSQKRHETCQNRVLPLGSALPSQTRCVSLYCTRYDAPTVWWIGSDQSALCTENRMRHMWVNKCLRFSPVVSCLLNWWGYLEWGVDKTLLRNCNFSASSQVYKNYCPRMEGGSIVCDLRRTKCSHGWDKRRRRLFRLIMAGMSRIKPFRRAVFPCFWLQQKEAGGEVDGWHG